MVGNPSDVESWIHFMQPYLSHCLSVLLLPKVSFDLLGYFVILCSVLL